jgi:hypothetical protein
MRPVVVMASPFADQESLAHPHAAKRQRRATRTVGRDWTVLFVALASASSVACHPGTPEPAPSSPVAPERQGAAPPAASGAASVAPPSPAQSAAPAVAAQACDKALFHRWETDKLVVNCMSARACVADKRMVEMSCPGKPDPAGCMRGCVTSGLTMIARAYSIAPPDLGTCVDCVSREYARYLEKCGASCPGCPIEAPEAERCRECANSIHFLEACLK